MNENSRTTLQTLGFIAATSLATISTLHADLVLETETAELGKKGDWLISSALQYERERDGSETIFTLNHYNAFFSVGHDTDRMTAFRLGFNITFSRD